MIKRHERTFRKTHFFCSFICFIFIISLSYSLYEMQMKEMEAQIKLLNDRQIDPLLIVEIKDTERL